MQILNSLPDLFSAFHGKSFEMKIWEEYSSAIHPELVSKCKNDSKAYDFDQAVLPVVNAALHARKKMEQIGDTFQAVTEELVQKTAQLFDREMELNIILYLGLCNGAGWATTLGDRDVILLGVEKIIELDWYGYEDLRALLFHEIGHFWHKTYGRPCFPANTPREKSIIQLYQEGIAMECEHILCGDSDYYHQDRNGWLLWCQQNESVIQGEYLKRLRANESTQDFFGDWCSFQGHSDVGYFLGCQFINYLKARYSMLEIANLPFEILTDEFTCYAASST